MNRSKLERLTVQIFRDRRRRQRLDTFRVMFNPSSFSMAQKVRYPQEDAIGTGGQKAIYFGHEPREGSMILVFDGTGIADTGDATPGSVGQRIEAFLRLTTHINGSIHEPNYLRIQWGDSALQSFDCRLRSAVVKYTLFDKAGAPLRAELSAHFVEDLDDPKRNRIEGKSSPDLTHARVVKSGDTLPLLCVEIYGAPEHYIRVARANGLDDLRNLTPGTRIVFPPLAK